MCWGKRRGTGGASMPEKEREHSKAVVERPYARANRRYNSSAVGVYVEMTPELEWHRWLHTSMAW